MLTTASLLGRKGQWPSLGEKVPWGSLLVVVPRDSLKARFRLLDIARSFAEQGGRAVIRYVEHGPDARDGALRDPCGSDRCLLHQ